MVFLYPTPFDSKNSTIFFLALSTLNPFRKVKYMYNLTDDSLDLSYRSVTTSSDDKYFIPSSVKVYRGMSGIQTNSFYTLTFTFITNFNLSEGQLVNGDTFDISFYREGNESVAIKTMTYSFGSALISINSTELESSPGVYTSEMSFQINVDDPEFDFEDSTKTTEYGTNVVLLDPSGGEVYLPEKVKVVLSLNAILGGQVSASFESGGFLSLFRNLDELMYSDIVVNESAPTWNEIATFDSSEDTPADAGADATTLTHYIDTDGGTGGIGLLYTSNGSWDSGVDITGAATDPVAASTDDAYYWNSTTGKLFQYDANTYVTSLNVKNIPLVHQSFFNDEASSTKFIKQLFVYIEMLKENLGKLETNTFFDLKFFNTYGDAQYYNTLTTNLELELDIYLKRNAWETGMDDTLRETVRLLVDNSNTVNALSISGIIRDLSVRFYNEIDHIDFKGLNGTFTQYIEKSSEINSNLFAPEYLNIPNENLGLIKVIKHPLDS